MALKERVDILGNYCRKAVVGGVIGAGTVLAAGTFAGAAVPWEMSSFGTMVWAPSTHRRPQEESQPICKCST